MLSITWDTCGKKYSVGESTQDVNEQTCSWRNDRIPKFSFKVLFQFVNLNGIFL